jgi:hypothetical protein
MQFPIDRRTAFGGMAGAALAYGASSATRGQTPESPGPARPVRTPADRVAAKLGERPSVRDKGAKGDGVAMDGAAIQDALQAYDNVWVPPGIYMIDIPLIIPSYRVLAFSSDAVFCPAHDDMAIFHTGEVSYASRILAPRIDGRGKRNVTAFDLRGFRHRAEIQHADILECARGIVLRELCWDTMIHMPWIRQTTNPIIIANGSNAVDIIHPGIDGFDVGIKIQNGPQYPTTSTRVWGGYVQNGRHGIVDEGCYGTVIDGTYFEGIEDADIVLARSIRPNLSRTQHYVDKGRTAIRMAGTDGATVIDPLMTSGSRSIGLYDIDNASRNVTRFESMTGAGVNQPLGNVGASGTLVREEGGVFAPVLAPARGAVRYERQEGRWRRSNGQMSVALDLHWSGAQAGGALAIAGLPASALLPSAPLPALTPAIVQGGAPSGAAGPSFARLGQDGVVRFFTLAEGREQPVAVGASGSAAVTLACLF